MICLTWVHPFLGLPLVASRIRDLASSASLLVLGSTVMGSAGCGRRPRCFRPFSSVLLGTSQIPAWYRLMGLGPPVMGGGHDAVFVHFWVHL